VGMLVLVLVPVLVCYAPSARSLLVMLRLRL
jgi:hypothetical protein